MTDGGHAMPPDDRRAAGAPGDDADMSAALAAEDPTALLRAEHRRLRADLRSLRDLVQSDAAGADVRAREALAALRERVSRHARIEEEVYLPGIEALLGDDAAATAEEAKGEHDGITIRASQLAEALAGSGERELALRHFERSLTIHFDNEEEQFLDVADRRLTPGRQRDLFRRMRAWQAREEGAHSP